jgi:hypothetical protein
MDVYFCRAHFSFSMVLSHLLNRGGGSLFPRVSDMRSFLFFDPSVMLMYRWCSKAIRQSSISWMQYLFTEDTRSLRVNFITTFSIVWRYKQSTNIIYGTFHKHNIWNVPQPQYMERSTTVLYGTIIWNIPLFALDPCFADSCSFQSD